MDPQVVGSSACVVKVVTVRVVNVIAVVLVVRVEVVVQWSVVLL